MESAEVIEPHIDHRITKHSGLVMHDLCSNYVEEASRVYSLAMEVSKAGAVSPHTVIEPRQRWFKPIVKAASMALKEGLRGQDLIDQVSHTDAMQFDQVN